MGEYGPILQIAANILAILAGIYAIVHRVKHFFTAAAAQRDLQMQKISSDVRDQLDRHEEKDQARHVENVQRFARLETMVNGNGHYKRKRVGA